MDYINAATPGTLSPHVLPVVDLQRMLQHIADTLLPMTTTIPISPEDTLHFYRYLRTPILIENKQFLLLVDMPIWDRSRQVTIHQILTLDIPQGNYSACYNVDTKYLGSHQGCNCGSGTLYYPISGLPGSKWSILQHHHTFSTISKPTILYSSFICTRALWISPQNAHCRYAKPHLPIYLPK